MPEINEIYQGNSNNNESLSKNFSEEEYSFKNKL